MAWLGILGTDNVRSDGTLPPPLGYGNDSISPCSGRCLPIHPLQVPQPSKTKLAPLEPYPRYAPVAHLSGE